MAWPGGCPPGHVGFSGQLPTADGVSLFHNWFPSASRLCEPVSTRVIAVEIAFLTSPSCGPKTAGCSLAAESPKIFPIGAPTGLFGSLPPLKYVSVADATVGSAAAFWLDGKLPTALKTLACC